MIVTILLLNPQNPDVFLIFLYPLVLFARRVCNHIHLHYPLYSVFDVFDVCVDIDSTSSTRGTGAWGVALCIGHLVNKRTRHPPGHCHLLPAGPLVSS